MRIFLTGMMGCGKSFWAKKIARTGNMHFADSDKYIESKMSMSIKDIFDQKGEVYFRILESQCLKEIILENENCIIATGGGAPCFHDNMDLLKKSGKVFYFKTDIPVLAKRILNYAEDRPLINTATIEETEKELARIFSDRKNIYEQSDVIIDMNQIDEANFAENFIKNYV